MKNEDILNLEFESRDLNRTLTIKDYFKRLLTTVWREGERFNGKRPFGNSGWERDLYKSLIKAKIIPGILDEDGYIEEVNYTQANKKVVELIQSCFERNI